MKFAVKVLSRSDLTFFEPQFRIRNAGNQKSINLNRDVLVDQLFPALPELMAGGHGELEVRLWVNGPGATHDEIRVVRKIAKGESYKNYRLNGEFVRNPEDSAARFNALVPGDVAVLVFEGAARPELIRLYVLSQAETADASLLEQLRPSGPTMVSLRRSAMADAVAAAPSDHPIRNLLLKPEEAEDLERAVEGDAEATDRLLRHPGHRRISPEQLADARRRAEETGQDGERLISTHLAAGSLNWKWRSAENAISPWDFEIGVEDDAVRVEVKATRGPHETPFHVSMAEIQAAAEPPRYALWRVSNLGASGGCLRVVEDFGAFARDLLARLSTLPEGVRPDGFTIDPSLLEWSSAAEIAWPDPDEL